MSKTAIILGSTGLTGGILLDLLVADPTFEKIKLFSRNSVYRKNPKIDEHLINLLDLEKNVQEFTADVVFCCVGTTQAKTPKKEMYHEVDYGIPVSAATLAKQNGINTFVVISSLGANSKSNVFYNRTKGEMERDVLNQQIENTYILRPSLIGGKRIERRKGEKIAQLLMKCLGFLIPKKYKMIAPEKIAKAMLIIEKIGYPKSIISSEDISEIASKW